MSRAVRGGALELLVVGACYLASCVTSHAPDDSALSLDGGADGAIDAGADAVVDAPPARPDPGPDTGECGTLGQPCDDDTGCSADLMCVRDLFIDAGVEGLCVPLPRGSCIGFGGGDPCPVETDVCTGSRYVTDTGWCFEPTQFRCLCGWPEFADVYDECARLHGP